MFLLFRRFSAYLGQGLDIFESDRERDVIWFGCQIGIVWALGPIAGLYLGDLITGPSKWITVLFDPFIIVGFVLAVGALRELMDRVYLKVSPWRGFLIGAAGGFYGTVAIILILVYLLIRKEVMKCKRRKNLSRKEKGRLKHRQGRERR